MGIQVIALVLLYLFPGIGLWLPAVGLRPLNLRSLSAEGAVSSRPFLFPEIHFIFRIVGAARTMRFCSRLQQIAFRRRRETEDSRYPRHFPTT